MKMTMRAYEENGNGQTNNYCKDTTTRRKITER